MVITDLDGTLLNDNRLVSEANLETLYELGAGSVTRVIATGRNLYSLKKVIPEDFPIDYLIFSSGAGIMHWPTKQIEQTYHLEQPEIHAVMNYLHQNEFDFMIHHQIPHNHYFLFFDTERENPDFYRRIDHYRFFARQGDLTSVDMRRASQFLVIEPSDRKGWERYVMLERELSQVKTIRTTSPLDSKSLWVELFQLSVSKGHAADYIASKLGIKREEVLAVGNDFNDIDLLEWAGMSFVVSNAASELRDQYELVSSNNKGGFTEAVRIWKNKSVKMN
jgi:Cof subfamily protein (haloacid dehalogenase superfamily)